MADQPYTNREIELFFKTIDTKLDTIRADIKETNKHFDSRVSKLEREVDNLKLFQTKAMTVWAVIVAAMSTAASFFLNRL